MYSLEDTRENGTSLVDMLVATIRSNQNAVDAETKGNVGDGGYCAPS